MDNSIFSRRKNELNQTKKLLTDAQKARTLRYFAIANLSEFWVKFGNSLFYKAYVTGNDLVLRRTSINYDLGLEGNERSLTRSIGIDKDSVIHNGLDYLWNKSLTFVQKVKDSDGTIRKVGGVFFGCADGQSDFPLKEFQQTSTQIVTEIDDLTRDEQLARYQWLGEISGLKFYLLSSGSKSIHLHIISNTPLPIEKIIYLRRLLCLVIDGDPAVARHHQPFRFPEMFRAEKGNIQEILQEGENYSYEQILEGIQKAFKAKGLRFPESISDAWWSGELLPILNSDKKNKAKKTKLISKEEKIEKLTHALDCGEKVFFEKRKKNQKVRLEKAQNYKSSFDNISDSDKQNLITYLFGNYIPPKTKDDCLYEDYRSMGCAAKNECGLAFAVELMDRFCPKSSGWGQVLESSTGSFTIGTIIYYARKWGGYNPHNDSDYDYDSQHGKVIFSGKDALRKATDNISNYDDIEEFSVISLEELRVAIEQNEISEFEVELIRQHNKLSKSFKKGFGDATLRLPNLNPEVITFHPDSFFLTTKEDFKQDTQIVIPNKFTNPVVKAKIVNHLRVIGVKYAFDNSQTGGGKSRTVPFLNNILYLDSNYKNPSIPELNNTAYLTPRTQHGLYSVDGLLVADPDEEIRNKADDPTNPKVFKVAEGNCHLKPAFRVLQNKGYNAEENSLPCQKCNVRQFCSHVSGLFKNETKNDIAKMESDGIGRMHPDQLTTEKYEKSFNNFALVWEEIGTLPPVTDYQYSDADISDLIIKLVQLDSSIIELSKRDDLIKSLVYLKSLMNPESAKQLLDGNGKYHGLPHNTIMANMPPPPDFSVDEYFSIIKTLDPNLEEIIPDTFFKTGTVDGFERTAKQAERFMREELRIEMMSKLDSLATNPIIVLDAILSFNPEYILSTQKVTTRNYHQWFIGVTTPNKKYAELASVAKFNLFLDATSTTTQVKAIFDIPDSEPLITITNEKILLDNVQVFNIDISGLGSNDWSQEAISRAKSGINLIKAQNPNKKIAVMTLKRYANALETNYWYGKHDRGTNELIRYDAIIFVGTPFINLGAVQRAYDVLFKGKDNSPTFEQFYNQKIYELRMQGMGRSRAQHFKEKVFHQFYLTTGEDLSYLQEMGTSYQEIKGESLSLDLGTKGHRTVSKIRQAVFSLINNGLKATQDAVAKTLDITKQAVSKAVKGIGLVWDDLISCQLSLYKAYKGKVDKIKPNDPHWSETALKETPNLILDQVINTLTTNGIKGYLQLVDDLELPYYMACRLLWAVSGLFNPLIPELLMNLQVEG